MNRFRVAFITDYLSGMGGTEASLVYICEALRRRGDELRVFNYCAESGAQDLWIRRLQDAGVQLTSRTDCGGDGSLDLKSFHRSVVEELKTWKPDVIHVLPVESLITKLLISGELPPETPVVGTVTSEPAPRCSWYTKNDFERFSIYDAIVVTGKSLIEGVRVYFDYQGHVEYIPHILPIEESETGLLTAGDLKNVYNLASITRLRVEKGVEFLVAALSMLKDSFPEITLTLYGETQELERIQIIARALNVDDRLFIHGTFSGQAEIHNIIKKHCIFLLSSLFEGTPMAILEAFARGRVVVSTDVGGCAELIGETDAGILVPAGDPRAMADRIAELLARPEDLIKKGESGLRRFKDLYDPENTTIKLRRFYAHLSGGEY